MLDFITWTADPAMFSIGSREIRWYGLAFALGFWIGYLIVQKMWKQEQLKPEWIDSLLMYTILGTAIGARLGHCLFYAPDYYLANPVEILKIWDTLRICLGRFVSSRTFINGKPGPNRYSLHRAIRRNCMKPGVIC